MTVSDEQPIDGDQQASAETPANDTPEKPELTTKPVSIGGRSEGRRVRRKPRPSPSPRSERSRPAAKPQRWQVAQPSRTSAASRRIGS